MMEMKKTKHKFFPLHLLLLKALPERNINARKKLAPQKIRVPKETRKPRMAKVPKVPNPKHTKVTKRKDRV